MTLFLALIACGDPCLETSVYVEVADDYAGPELQGVSAELENGDSVELSFYELPADASQGSDQWEYDGPEGTELNALVSATLVFDDTNEQLDVSDFEMTSGGGGHICESLVYTYVMSDPE